MIFYLRLCWIIIKKSLRLYFRPLVLLLMLRYYHSTDNSDYNLYDHLILRNNICDVVDHRYQDDDDDVDVLSTTEGYVPRC